MAYEEVMYYAPDEENLRQLESEGLSYPQMAMRFKTPQTDSNICKYFKKFGIHHKTKTERIMEFIEANPTRSTHYIAKKVGASIRMVNIVKASMPLRTNIECWNEGIVFNCIISGHSGYAPKGKDIVCAAISTLGCFSVNYMNDLSNKVKYVSRDGYLEFSFPVETDVQQIYVNDLVEHFKELERQYPNNVRLYDKSGCY